MAVGMDPNYSQISNSLVAEQGEPEGEPLYSSAQSRKRGALAFFFFVLSGVLMLAAFKMVRFAHGPAVQRGQIFRVVERAETKWSFVDGGLGRKCQDEDSTDGSDGIAFKAHVDIVSVDECKTLCLEADACTGIEYNSDLSRCEVWIQPIGGGAKSNGYACLAKGEYKSTKDSSADSDEQTDKKKEKAKEDEDKADKKVEKAKEDEDKVDKKDDQSTTKEKKTKGSDKSTTDKKDDDDEQSDKKTEKAKSEDKHDDKDQQSDKKADQANKKCTSKFVPPPKPDSATQHNGVALNDVCIPGDGPHHVFLIGDWGGIPSKGGKISCAPHLNSRWNDSKPYAFIWPPDESAQFRVRDQMRTRAVKSKPDYVLNVGDDFYWAGINDNCGSADITKMYSKGGNGVYKVLPVDQFTDEFEKVYTGEGLDGKTWLGVLGNHDYGGWLFNSAWDQIIGYTWNKAPTNTGRWMTPAMYYSVTVKYSDFSVDYYFMDTNLFDALDPPNPSPHNICSQQHNEKGASCAPIGPSNIWTCQKWFRQLWTDQKIWLDKIVPKSKADWRIVVTHFPPYWGSGEWKELSDKHHFDLHIAGHRHVQNTHKPGDKPTMIWENDPHKLTDDFLDPVAWVVTGGGGGVTSEHTPDADGKDDQYGFMDMTLTKSDITIDALSHGGHVRRSFTIEPSWPHNPHYVKKSDKKEKSEE